MQRLRRVKRCRWAWASVEMTVDAGLELARTGHRRRIEQPDHARALTETGEDVVEHQFLLASGRPRTIEPMCSRQQQLILFDDLRQRLGLERFDGESQRRWLDRAKESLAGEERCR